MLRYAGAEAVQAGRGLCVNCGAADFLKTVAEADRLLAGSRNGATALLAPHVQAQFAAVMRAANADARPEEIDWGHVVEHWDLPFPARPSKAKAR